MCTVVTLSAALFVNYLTSVLGCIIIWKCVGFVGSMLLKEERKIPCLGLLGKGVRLKGVLLENIKGFFFLT